ncbi:hypothetical protein HMPREF1624_03946 [Sporothrix schenckii ATCC 58251]|uniref:Uncharacterized protein n=1 Tax=Sporothrix schenckii (strain ATCC 58251 / de Perez 2211183) TaxID=1391915 RepID=U7Q076_SPOS1|nr:hypothetical protein HMPREF1624_03946 [Sporothrix schenckii ATCC 58251]
MPLAKLEKGEKPSGSVVDNTGDSKPTLSLRDQEILMAAWLSIKGAEPQVDYEKLAKILGLKNAHCANTIFYNVRKKVKAYHNCTGDASDVQSALASPKTPTPQKRAAAKGSQTPRSGRAAKRPKIETEAPLKDEQDGSV